MSDFTSHFWSGWIISLTLVSLIGLGWLSYSVYFGKNRDLHEGDAVWDETLREGSNPPPLWWFGMIFSLMVFSVIYLILYPGLGEYPGALHWSSEHRLHTSMQRYQREFDAVQADWRELPLAELANHAEAMRSANRIYMHNCATCHGADARGQARRFPNLMDDVWSWGGDEAQITHTLVNGRVAVMPPWSSILQDEGVDQVTDYVLALSRGEADAAAGSAGAQKYAQFCVACHGAAGEGNVLLGAPNLRDDVWLYGGDREAIYVSIAAGRNGHMPAQRGRLSDMQIRLLTAWLKGGARTAGFPGATPL